MKKTVKSRRDFVKNAALALGGFYIVPRHVLGGPGFTAPSDKLQVAGIGAGIATGGSCSKRGVQALRRDDPNPRRA
jgi:hypothetical protein